MALTLPQPLLPKKEMQFAPVPEDDGDELTEAIKNDITNQDDNWDLREDVDGEQIAAFLDDALKEIGAEAVEE